MSAPRFSIVLPTHNRADVLPCAIRSALWQTEADFELLVAGDGCTDGTTDVVASFGDARIRWFDLAKAPGIGYANRNVVLREARGRYIAYLAHDDLWFPDHLERLGALLDRAGVEFAYSRGLSVSLDGRITPFAYNLGIPVHRSGLARGDSAITMCTVVHTRACLEKYGYWDETLVRAGDLAMWHGIVGRGGPENLAFHPEPTALHFVANWRAAGAEGVRARLGARVSAGLVDGLHTGALRLPSRDGEPQQVTVWYHLAAEPAERVAAIRREVVQYQDLLLWQARPPAGLLGLRLGLGVGTQLNRLSRALLWLASRERRQIFRQLSDRTRTAGRKSPEV